MEKYIYYTKEGKFESNNSREIIINNLHSPDEDTPALIFPNDIKHWFFEGKLHRLNGPAIIFSNGSKQFWLNGIRYEFEKWRENHPDKTKLALYLLKQ